MAGPILYDSSNGMPLLGRIAASSAQFANKHGLYLGRRSTKVHVALYRRTGGKLGGHLPGWPSARILLLDHTGAKSGVRRTSPLMYHEDGDIVAVVASKGGQPTHPALVPQRQGQPGHDDSDRLRDSRRSRSRRDRRGARSAVAEVRGVLSRI